VGDNDADGDEVRMPTTVATTTIRRRQADDDDEDGDHDSYNRGHR
jgi:hypothetical protein